MRSRRHFLAAALAGAVGFFTINSAVAAESATEFAERTSAELVKIIDEGQSYYKADPDKLTNKIGNFLDSVVDFKGISRGVMGKRYFSEATDAQKEAFAKTFRLSLIKTFSKAVIGLGQLEIRVVNTSGSSDSKKSVDMIVKSVDDGTETAIRYSMAAKTPGNWIVRNMLIKTLNLGVTYQSQFASSMSQNGGDMDKVIASWSDTEAAK